MYFSSEKNPEVSVILPCRNEEAALGTCIDTIKRVLQENNMSAEIIVSDSSTDRSAQIAENAGVVVIKHNKAGYGNAYLEGFARAKGTYIFCADADGTYDFSEIPRFINELKNGADIVIGNRFKGKIENSSMPFSHKYIGNPFLSATLRLFFGSTVHDAHCGMRALRRDTLPILKLQTTGMEFASEMIIEAINKNLKIQQLPINYYKRIGNSKLHSITDAWRHMRFMLLYSPLFLFFIPGLLLFLFGIGSMIWIYAGTPIILGIELVFHPMFVSSLLTITGYQLMIFALFAKTYAFTHFNQDAVRMNKIYKHITIESASIVGLLFTVIGITLYARILTVWLQSGFGELNEIKNSIVALTSVIIGIQTIFSSFMLSILSIKGK